VQNFERSSTKFGASEVMCTIIVTGHSVAKAGQTGVTVTELLIATSAVQLGGMQKLFH
jgi:hypothetical protein